MVKVLSFLILLVLCAENDRILGEVTLVTALFNIKHIHGRVHSEKQYFVWFQKWARLKNNLIVFCYGETVKNKIASIRKDFGLENRTAIVIVDDVFAVESEIYDRMLKISENSYFKDFRVEKNPRENIPEYCYITCMKSYFIYKANNECDVKTESIAWLDFGYGYGNLFFPFEEDWRFTLKCELANKILLTYPQPKQDSRPMIEMVRTVHPSSMSAGFILCPKKLAAAFWKVVKDSLHVLLCVGLMDDEQAVFLLACRIKPEYFELKRMTYNWLNAPKQFCNGKHMFINRFRNESRREGRMKNHNMV